MGQLNFIFTAFFTFTQTQFEALQAIAQAGEHYFPNIDPEILMDLYNLGFIVNTGGVEGFFSQKGSIYLTEAADECFRRVSSDPTIAMDGELGEPRYSEYIQLVPVL